MRERDEAVSNVLGGIMFVVVMFLFYAMVRTSFVPVWEEEREAMFANEVQAQLAQLAGEVDRQASNRTLAPVTSGVTLGEPQASRLLSAPRLPGTMVFDPGTSGSRLDAPELLKFLENGQVIGGAHETWTPVTGPTDEVLNVGDVHHFRLRINKPMDKGDGEFVQVRIVDVDGNSAGTLRAYIESFGSQRGVFTQVKDASGNIVYDQGWQAHHQANIEWAWVDALDPEILFDDLLAGAKKPMTLQFTKQGIIGDFTLTYDEVLPGGTRTVGTNGVLVAPYSQTLGGGSLSVRLPSENYAEQEYILENGAILVRQDDGVAMKFDPNFEIRKINAATVIRMTVPGLIGDGVTASQTGTVPVTMKGAMSSHIEGTVPMWKYRVTTSHAATWADFFERTAVEAGLPAAEYAVAFDAAAKWAEIAVYGVNTDPTDLNHDVTVDAHMSLVRVSIPA